MTAAHKDGNDLILHSAVADAVRRYGDRVREVLAHGDDESAALVARSEVPALLTAVGLLTEAHGPDRRGRCGTCRPRGWRRVLLPWSRAPHVPCPAYRSVQHVLMPQSTGRRAAPEGVGVRVYTARAAA